MTAVERVQLARGNSGGGICNVCIFPEGENRGTYTQMCFRLLTHMGVHGRQKNPAADVCLCVLAECSTGAAFYARKLNDADQLERSSKVDNLSVISEMNKIENTSSLDGLERSYS